MNEVFDQCYYDDGVWRLEGVDEREFDEDEQEQHGNATPFTNWMEEHFLRFVRCPYCSSGLEKCTLALDFEDGSVLCNEKPLGTPDEFETMDFASLWSCPDCTYWQWYAVFENRGLHATAAVSVLTAFDPTVPEGCWAELAQHLRRHEEFVALARPTRYGAARSCPFQKQL